ncbi:hypothetical protein ONZ45_g2943 [Pleurotus djamor]|nr:hypothetical protein ONZ45_g2943 [Pleurotus djamor]
MERRDDIGGVWYLDELSESSRRRWPSPAYPGMVGNVLPDFLYFSGHPFPKPDRPNQPFPTLEETYAYLQDFAKPYIPHVRLNTEVERIVELSGWKGWKVSMKDWNQGGKQISETWDAVVVAVGWFDNLVWPATPGIEELKNEGMAIHAKSWEGPEEYKDKRVLVVGNANSANDVAAQLTRTAQTPVFRSVRRDPFPGFPSLSDEKIQNVPPLAQFTISPTGDGPKQAMAVLKDGTILEDIDTVIFATGYKPSPSFVHVGGIEEDGNLKPLVSAADQPQRIPSVHRHIIYAPNHTLGFIGSPMSFTPFTIADVSSTWLSLAWSGQIEYPDSVDGRLQFERERLAKLAETASFFLSNEGTDKVGEDARNVCVDGLLTSFISYNVLSVDEEPYAQNLREDITAVRPELGEVLPEWTKERYEQRNGMYKIKHESLQASREG